MESYQRQAEQNSYGFAVADHISAMLAYWDKDLVCRFANASYLEWFGRTHEEMVDKITIKELLGPLYLKYRRYILGALDGKTQTFEREIIVPGGEIRHSIANYFPHIVDGEVRGFYAHVADITSVKLLENELIRSNEIISKQNNQLLNFANIVSHNLNTYAFNLATIVDFLVEAESEEEKNQFMAHLKTISKGFSSTMKNLNEIVNAQNQGKLKYEWVNLHECIENAVGILINQLKESCGQINNRVSPEIKLWANAAYMDSIILNFLTNAIKYRHPDRSPEVDLSASISGRELILKIKDNGLGIDLNKHRKELFGMYKTFHGNEDAKGIGLYIIKFQVESMGGQIEVESEVNAGTTFTICFPIKSFQIPA